MGRLGLRAISSSFFFLCLLAALGLCAQLATSGRADSSTNSSDPALEAAEKFQSLATAVKTGTAPKTGCDLPGISAQKVPSSSLSRAWSFDCEHPRYQDPALREKMELAFADILDIGVARLRRINPGFANLLSARLQNLDKVSITCTYALRDLEGISADASTVSKLTPQGWDATLNLHEYYVLQVLKKSIAAGKPIPDELKAVIFHEFLHVVHMDNETAAIHREGPLPHATPGSVTHDLIYACATQAYPAQRVVQVDSSGRSLTNSREVCETCALARPKQKVAEGAEEFTLADDLASQAQARRACRNVPTTYANSE